jgi:single-strand DNA-binding protein
MNKVILHGFTGKDPEIKTLESGKKIAKFSLATTSFRKDADGKKLSDWHSLIFWEKLADLCEKYVKKGSELIVEGEITYRNYVDKDGATKYFTEIICNGIEFCGKKEEPKSEPKEEIWQGKKEVKAMSNINDLPGNVDTGNIPDDTEIPF